MLAAFIKERNDALFSLDRKKIEEYSAKYGFSGASDLPDRVFWAGVYKAICNMSSAPADVVEKAKNWLAANGFSETIGS